MRLRISPPKSALLLPRQLIQFLTPRHGHFPGSIHLLHILKEPATRLLHHLLPSILLHLALHIQMVHIPLLRHLIQLPPLPAPVFTHIRRVHKVLDAQCR